MLSVHQPIQMNRQEMHLDSNTLSQRDELPMLQKPKQIEKKQLITPAKVIIGVAIFCILAMASYKVYTIAFPSQADSKMNQIHSNKIISHAGSSSGQETSSQTGSQSSKSSRDSNKPIGVSQTVGRDIISSNMGTGSDDGEEGPSEQDNDGDRRKKHMEKNKLDGSSTQGDSQQSVEEEDSGEIEGQNVVWPNNGGTNGMPLVGSRRP